MTKNVKTIPGLEKPLNEAQLIMSGALNPVFQNNTQNWDGLEGIYQSLAEAIYVANKSVVEMFKLPGVLEHIENRQETKIAILGLDKDIKFFKEELKKIHSEHEGKTGTVANEEELGTCLGIFEKYHSFQTTYQSVIMPTVISVSQDVGKAAEAINRIVMEQKALSDAQNPNIITEVEIKEPTQQTEVKDANNE